jgi:hypothetical protein
MWVKKSFGGKNKFLGDKKNGRVRTVFCEVNQIFVGQKSCLGLTKNRGAGITNFYIYMRPSFVAKDHQPTPRGHDSKYPTKIWFTSQKTVLTLPFFLSPKNLFLPPKLFLTHIFFGSLKTCFLPQTTFCWPPQNLF